ncbi:MAG: chorismate synthase [Clostridia bacterium]
MLSNLKISLFGESHGEAIGATIEGLPCGVALDLDFLRSQSELRKPKGKISTKRQEKDDFKIVSGFFDGYTTGSPLTILIFNENTKSRDYDPSKLRPSHADYTAYEKYKGFQDYRGGGHFSGRITAPLVLIGAICLQILAQKGVSVGSHISKTMNFQDVPFAEDLNERLEQIKTLNETYFPTICPETSAKMQEMLEICASEGDSLGGIIESCILGLEPGIGEPFWNSIESVLAHLLFSVPAVKGVEFGLGFDFVNHYGSQANDALYVENGEIRTKTNNNGGVNGGISNGMPIMLKTMIKPTPSIYKEQQTVDFATKENITHQIHGRHDPFIAHRARVVIDSMIGIGILDLLMSKYGHDVV